MKKYMYLTVAWLSLILGSIGIFLPLLPTTPFLLLSAFCFERSSERFHRWIIKSPVFGKYIQDYQEKKGMKLKSKIISILFMGTGMALSAYKVDNMHARISMLVIFIAVSWHIYKIKTLEEES